VPGTTIIGSALERRVGGSACRRGPYVLAAPPRGRAGARPYQVKRGSVPAACGAGAGGRGAPARSGVAAPKNMISTRAIGKGSSRILGAGPYSLPKSLLPLLPSVQILFVFFCAGTGGRLMSQCEPHCSC
jgi:hypothetical protein